MSDKKSIRELIIKVKQQNAIKVSKDIDRISESLLEATEYAELFNQTLSQAQVPKEFQQLIRTFDNMEASLEEIAKQTRYTTNSIGAMRGEALEIADVYQDSFKVISEGLDDLASDALRTGAKTEKALAGYQEATQGVTKSQGRLNNALKDTNRQGANQSRQFSKMAKSAGGLASSYALVAANIFAVTEGYRLLSEAASVSRLEEVSTVISAGIGVSIAGTAKAMEEATDGAISYQAALRQAAAATAYGFDTEQITEFTQVARRAAVVLGVDMADALNRVVKGISKAEVELLDELGVTVRLNEAFAKYAAEHNIAAASLNSFQRQQALANEVILKSEQNLGAADEALRSTSWEQFGANVSSATNQLLRFIADSDTALSLLGSFNSAFSEISQLARSDAEFTPYTKTLEEAPDALSSIVAYNNLLKERERLLREGAVARGKAAKLVGEGVDGTSSISDYSTFNSDEFKKNDQYNILQAQLTGVQHELDLTNEALEEHAARLGISTAEVALVSDSIQNLGLLSRSLGSDLTTLNNDVRGKATNPYLGMSSSIQEAEKDIDLLLSKNLTLDEALSKLKVSKVDYENFGDIKGYVSLLDTQRELALENEKIASRVREEEHGSLFLAQQELALLKKKHKAELAVLDTATLTVEQRRAEFVAQQKVVAAQEKVQALNFKLLTEQAGISKQIAEENAGYQSAIGAASDRLRIEQRTLDVMLAQNAEAALAGEASHYGKDQVDAQTSTTTGASSALSSTLNSGNVSAQQEALGTLSPDLASATTSVYALADAWAVMGDQATDSAQYAAAAASAMSSTMSAVNSLVSASAGASASAIDLEIAALENSGLSQEEQEQKSKELNKKKIKEQEKYAKASILISTAQGMMLAIATSGNIYAGLALAAVTAAAGAMAYEQASNSASSQLAGLDSAASSTPTSLTVGDVNDSLGIDVSSDATQSERAQSLGESGVYGRASYGGMSAGKSYLVGEHGKELITPKVDSKVSRPTESSGASGGAPMKQVVYNINALDAQSFSDRMYELGPVMEDYYEEQGRKLAAN